MAPYDGMVLARKPLSKGLREIRGGIPGIGMCIPGVTGRDSTAGMRSLAPFFWPFGTNAHRDRLKDRDSSSSARFGYGL